MRALALVLVLSVAFVAGCGGRTGFLRDSPSANELQYKMDVVAVEHKRTVSGTASIGMVLCVIPISTEYYKRAMEELHQKASLNPNEVLTNFREDHALTSFLGFYCSQDVTISADVVKLTGTQAPPAPPSG